MRILMMNSLVMISRITMLMAFMVFLTILHYLKIL